MSSSDPNNPEPLSNANPYPPPPPIFNEPPPAEEPVQPGMPPPPPPGAGNAGSYSNYGSSNTTVGGVTKEERTWAMVAHLSGMIAAVLLSWTHLPFLGIIGPAVVYFIKKDESEFIADQAREALNFTITMTVLLTVLLWVGLLLVWTLIIPIIVFPLAGIIGIVAFVLVLIAAFKAYDGIRYRYPFNLRLI